MNNFFKKTLLGGIFLFLNSVLFSQEKASSYPPDIQVILDRGSLIVGIVNEIRFPYYMVDDKGRKAGLDLDMAKDIAKQLKVKLEVKEAKNFEELIDLIFRKEVDLGFSLSKTLKRAEKILFTEPYLTVPVGLLVNRLYEKGKTHSQLIEILNQTSETIGYLGHSEYYEEIVRKLFPKAKKRAYTQTKDLAVAVKNGEIEACMATEWDIKTFGLFYPEGIFTIWAVIFEDFNALVCMGIPWESRNLTFWLNSYLELNDVHLTLENVMKKYQGFLEEKK